MSQQTTLLEIGVNAAGHYDVRMARLLSHVLDESNPQDVYEFRQVCEKVAHMMYQAAKSLLESQIPSSDQIS